MKLSLRVRDSYFQDWLARVPLGSFLGADQLWRFCILLEKDMVLFRGWEVRGARAMWQRCSYCPIAPVPASQRKWFWGACVRAPDAVPGLLDQAGNTWDAHGMETATSTATVLQSISKHGNSIDLYTQYSSWGSEVIWKSWSWLSAPLAWRHWGQGGVLEPLAGPENGLADSSLFGASDSSSVKWGTCYYLLGLLWVLNKQICVK